MPESITEARQEYRPKVVLRLIVALTTVTMIVGNVLANALPLFGRGTAEISDRYLTLVTPAGYVFAIWGLIYIGLLAYSLAQFIHPLRNDPLPDQLAWWIIASNVFNVVWLVLWHSLNIYWTVPVMLLLLGSLVGAYLTARRDRPEKPSALERWAVRAPLGLYLGWISVATIANVSNALVAAEWDGFGVPPEWWSVIVLAVGTALALINLVRVGDCVYAGVFVWAFVGISQATTADIVSTAALALAGLIALGVAFSAISRRRLV